jgi:cytochrome c biogenesis protein CcdA
MYDLLLPASDAGVAAQFGLLLVVALIAGWFARHNRDILRLVIGIAILLAGLMALRAVH